METVIPTRVMLAIETLLIGELIMAIASVMLVSNTVLGDFMSRYTGSANAIQSTSLSAMSMSSDVGAPSVYKVIASNKAVISEVTVTLGSGAVYTYALADSNPTSEASWENFRQLMFAQASKNFKVNAVWDSNINVYTIFISEVTV